VQFQKIDNLVDVGQLLLVGNVARLTEESGELESFTDSRLGKVDIHLLTVTGSTLEGHGERVAVQEHFTTDNTFVLAGSQDVHECGLSLAPPIPFCNPPCRHPRSP